MFLRASFEVLNHSSTIVVFESLNCKTTHGLRRVGMRVIELFHMVFGDCLLKKNVVCMKVPILQKINFFPLQIYKSVMHLFVVARFLQ